MTTLQMELTDWQLDEDVNVITGLVLWDIFRIYKKGNLFVGKFMSLEKSNKFIVCKRTKTSPSSAERNVICFVSFSLTKEGQVDVPNQIVKSYHSRIDEVRRMSRIQTRLS